jgi:hypothetical protein
VKKKIDKLVH